MSALKSPDGSSLLQQRRVLHTGLLLLFKCPPAAEQIDNPIPWNQLRHELPHVAMTSYRILLPFLFACHELQRLLSAIGVGVCIVIGDLICVLCDWPAFHNLFYGGDLRQRITHPSGLNLLYCSPDTPSPIKLPIALSLQLWIS